MWVYAIVQMVLWDKTIKKGLKFLLASGTGMVDLPQHYPSLLMLQVVSCIWDGGMMAVDKPAK